MDNKTLSICMVLLLAIAATAVGGCALQEDLVLVNDRVGVLQQKHKKAESDREAVRSELARYHEQQVALEEDYRGRHAELHTLMKDLREEMAGLRGHLEISQHDAQKKIGSLSTSQSKRTKRWKHMDKSLQSSLDRIVRLEQYLGMEPSEKLASSKPKAAAPGKGKPGVKKTPDELYAEAKQRFDRGEYESAREQFRGFLDQHPKAKMADNAQFWIGEVYYREKWYEKAILEYQKVIERYPKGDKIRGALLKQGFSFLNLGDEPNARLILKELVRKFPKTNEAGIAKKKLKTLK